MSSEIVPTERHTAILREALNSINHKAQQTATLIFSGAINSERGGATGLAFAGLLFGSTAALLGGVIITASKGDVGLMVGGIAIAALGVGISVGGYILENH